MTPRKPGQKKPSVIMRTMRWNGKEWEPAGEKPKLPKYGKPTPKWGKHRNDW